MTVCYNKLWKLLKASEENIAEVPSVINAVWRKMFRTTAKRRKSPHCRQMEDIPNIYHILNALKYTP